MDAARAVAVLATFTVVLGAVHPAAAQTVARPASVDPGAGEPAKEEAFTLTKLLHDVEKHFPQILAERERVRGQRGMVLSADGGFDPTLTVSGDATQYGYYEYRRLGAAVEQPTPLWGATVTAGWRWADGNIPDYYGELETLSGGELRGAVRVPLWRDGAIDERRARIRSQEFGLDSTRAGLVATRLRVARDAVMAYVAWLAAGKRLQIASQMLSLATARDEFVRSRASAGAVPAIEVLENERVVVLREAALVRAERAVEQAAIRLSLYVRSADGKPRTLPVQAMPKSFPALVDDENHSAEEVIRRAVEARPETAALDARLRAARVEVDLAENRVGPRLDLTVGATRDLGGANDATERNVLGQTSLDGSLLFSLPIPLRADRGRLEKAEADARALEHELSWLRDQVAVEVRDAISRLEAAERSLELTRRSAEVSRQVADGERTRFELGSTSLLTVNLREEAAADAEISLVDSQAEVIASLALLRTARGVWPLEAPEAGGLDWDEKPEARAGSRKE